MKKLLIKGIVYTIFAQILSFILVFLCIIFLTNKLFSIIVGVAALFILCGLYINFTLEIAQKSNFRKKNEKNKWFIYPLVMSSGASIPLFLTWILLLLSKQGAKTNALIIYKFLNRFFYIITDVIFQIKEMSSINTFYMIILFICCIIPYIVIVPTYYFFLKKQNFRER